MEELLNKTIDDFIQYDLNGRWLVAKILRIHDGDTYTIGWKEGDIFVKTNIRLVGIDTPELRSKTNGGLESKLCRLGRNWLISKYLNQVVSVECLSMDKYGRLLANVYEYPQKTASFNQMLIDNKFARAYGGDLHKNDWTVDELNQGIAIAESLGIKDE
jgi:endonuclease YncB( thermonuclease family)